MEKEQKFSVSIAVYHKDNPIWFREALTSVFEQSIGPDEVVLVVDGPISDDLDRVIKEFKERYCQFKVIYLKENVGHGEARRIGLEQCTHELVAIMDADDICVFDRFKKQLKCFENDEELCIVGGHIKEFVNEPSNVVGIREVPTKDIAIKEYMKSRCPMNLVTVMFKKTDVLNAGGFIDWYCEEDYYLWLRMFLRGCKFKNIEECLVYVRVGKEMYKRRGGWPYFRSEARLQKYMLDHNIIGIGNYVYNVFIRFMVQVVLPNRIRGWVFQKFARKTKKEKTIVSLSFDDGREDSYRMGYKIMEQYNLKGTIHVPTGYVDGTWEPKGWVSSKGPITIENLMEMKQYGFEIASHGDQHQTKKDDLLESIKKLKIWGLVEDEVGFSIPNSLVDEQDKSEFYECLKDNNVVYVRGGRSSQCYSLKLKMIFGLYKLTKCQYFYNTFNQYNCIDLYPKERINPSNLYSVVIRSEDNPNSVIKFIKKNINKGKWIILMLHSIEQKNESNYIKDTWCWDAESFEKLCQGLKEISNSHGLDVLPIRDVIENNIILAQMKRGK